MTRSPFYAKADRHAQWFSTATGPQRATNRLVCWHTTEMGVPGEPWPRYLYNGQVGGSAPHFTVKPDRANRRLLWRQHYRADESSKALRHPRGTPETNNSGVLQVELGGTSADGQPGYNWARADTWALRELADFSLWALDEWAIPLTDQHRSWPSLYTNSNGYIIQREGSARLTWAQWASARGHVGHTHVPGNDHIDGPRTIPAMLAYASTIKSGDDVTPEEIKAIARAVLAEPVTTAWTGGEVSLEWAISSSHFYAIQGGHEGTTPLTASSEAGQPTVAKRVLDTLDDLGKTLEGIKAQLPGTTSGVL